MVKDPATYEEMIAKLQEHGCVVKDEMYAKLVLKEIGYYRLSAYFLPFRKTDRAYKEGTDFYRVARIYEFDKEMRKVLFSAIEIIEIYLRSQLSYYHAHTYGSLGYKNPPAFGKVHKHKKFEDNLKREISANRQLPFVKHHISQYGGEFPIWVIMELFTFGMLSCFYSDLKRKDKKAIAKTLYGESDNNITSWLRCCTDLRNICAHYGRLYFRKFAAVPAALSQNSGDRSLFSQVLTVKALYPDKKRWESEVLTVIRAIIEEYNDVIDLFDIGFPSNWENLLQ